MNEENFNVELARGIEPNEDFYNQTLSEIEIKYHPRIRLKEMPVISSSRVAYALLRPCFNDCLYHHEEAWILLLNNNRVIGVARVNSGGINTTLVDTRIILQYMLKSNATGVILSHNHPSQNLSFSNEDLRLTEKLKQCCEIMDMHLVDHLIIGDDGYRSYIDEGL